MVATTMAVWSFGLSDLGVKIVPGSEHFRNIHCHDAETYLGLLSLRVDESLCCINARFLQDLIQSRVAEGTNIKTWS